MDWQLKKEFAHAMRSETLPNRGLPEDPVLRSSSRRTCGPWLGACFALLICFSQPSWSRGFVDPNDPETQRVHRELFAKAVANFRSKAKTPARHLAEYMTDKKGCVAGFALLRNDAEFISAMSGGPTEEISTFVDALRVGRFAGEPAVRYLIDNESRFDINVDFHFGGAAANINEIHCNPLLYIRILKMEELGSSKESWGLREEHLNRVMDYLDYPDNENSSGMYSFEYLLDAVTEASRRYRTVQRRAFQLWLEGAVSRVRANTHIKRMSLEDSGIVFRWAEKLDAVGR